MDIVSLVIMALGLMALVAIYVISRVSRQHLPKKQKRHTPIPVLRDDEGDTMSSIMEDRPARDGKRPAENAPDLSDVMKPAAKAKATKNTAAHAAHNDQASANVQSSTKPRGAQLPPQIILFIAADIDDGFSGDLVLEALDNGGLQYGEMDVFHRNVLTDNGEASLFSVANGVEPWTLKPVDLEGSSTPGLSLIMNLPAPIATDEAMHDFIRTAERLTSTLNGVLKNTQQEPLTAEQRQTLLDMAAA